MMTDPNRVDPVCGRSDLSEFKPGSAEKAEDRAGRHSGKFPRPNNFQAGPRPNRLQLRQSPADNPAPPANRAQRAIQHQGDARDDRTFHRAFGSKRLGFRRNARSRPRCARTGHFNQGLTAPKNGGNPLIGTGKPLRPKFLEFPGLVC